MVIVGFYGANDRWLVADSTTFSPLYLPMHFQRKCQALQIDCVKEWESMEYCVRIERLKVRRMGELQGNAFGRDILKKTAMAKKQPRAKSGLAVDDNVKSVIIR
jgi:hypothetical protein